MKNGVFCSVTPCEPHGITEQRTPFLNRNVDNVHSDVNRCLRHFEIERR
jgi:hypothetical protein